VGETWGSGAVIQPYGRVTAYGQAVESIPGLCRSGATAFEFRGNTWRPAAGPPYAAALKKGKDCRTVSVDQLVDVASVMEEHSLRRLLLAADEVYAQILATEKQAVAPVTLRYVGLADLDGQGYFVLTYEKDECTSYELYIRGDPTGGFHYATFTEVTC
jgi:hypothetical protein